MSFYQAALQSARSAKEFDPRTVERLRSAQGFIQQRAAEFQHKLDEALAGFRPENAAAGARLTHSLDMLKGARQIFPQQPLVFYYPYLAQRQFFEREEFDWVPEIEAATPVIREELVALLNRGADFRPYVARFRIGARARRALPAHRRSALEGPAKPHRQAHALRAFLAPRAR